MGSDDPTGGFSGVQGMTVTCSVADTDEAQRVFGALADGGEATQPLIETFFSRLPFTWYAVDDRGRRPRDAVAGGVPS